MQFLKTLLWVVVAVLLAIVATRNWHEVTLNLWGNLQADIKVPVLMGLMFLLGFLPTFLIYRARMWTLRRRLDSLERQKAEARAPGPAPQEQPAT
jgi:uncharacterized integral membrane protein